MRKTLMLPRVALALLMGALAVIPAVQSIDLASAAVPPAPTYGTAAVDGDTGEWDLGDDFFAEMYEAGKTSKPDTSKLYLRYDCESNTLYALVLANDGLLVIVETDESYIKVAGDKKVGDTDGDDGNPPDFAWVGRDGDRAQGWEASFVLAPGSYDEFYVHTNVDDDGSQTSSTDKSGITLEITCPP
ncbi:MAG: hypothetical protein SV910_08570, partial [Chloroflexota bacterium]|nr:hypothetical protein [Chloroflexota bacterium]